MQRKPVNSSNIRSIGYDGDTMTLEVEFANNSVYQYFKVPSVVYRKLMSAESHGSALDELVKKPGYRYKQVRQALSASLLSGW